MYIVHGPKSYLDILDYAVYVGAHPVAVLAYLWRLNNIFFTETIWGSSPGSENYFDEESLWGYQLIFLSVLIIFPIKPGSEKNNDEEGLCGFDLLHLS